MRRLPLILLLTASVTVTGQQAPPVVRSEVAPVLVDATVRDREGRPIPWHVICPSVGYGR